jgi:outer membrane protein OmpA-like peptidoglycan-associated protein
MKSKEFHFPKKTIPQKQTTAVPGAFKLLPIAWLLLCITFSYCNRKISTIPTPNAVTPSPKEKNVTFGPVYFKKYKTVLTPDAMTSLYDAGVFLYNNPEYHLIIESFSDDGCGGMYSTWLADQRAKDIRDWLSDYGPYKIDGKRIFIKSFGDTKPLNAECGNDTACHTKNRRAELTGVKTTQRDN